MEITEFLFRPKKTDEGIQKQYTRQYLGLIEKFFSELAKNGLALESGAQVVKTAQGYECRCVACDKNAITEEHFAYETKKTLESLIRMSDGLPAIKDIGPDPLHGHCTCRSPSHLVMEPCAEREGTPIICGDCCESIPLYRLASSAADMEFDDVLRWRKLYRAYLYQCLLGIDSIDGEESYQMLHECVSTLTLAGRALAGQVERFCSIPVYYPIYYQFERVPDRCPQCGASWRNSYPDGVKSSHVCLACRLFASEQRGIYDTNKY